MALLPGSKPGLRHRCISPGLAVTASFEPSFLICKMGILSFPLSTLNIFFVVEVTFT